MRAKGRKMGDDERQNKPLRGLLGFIRQFIRTDFGGQSDKEAVVCDKVRQYCKERDIVLSEEGIRLVAGFAIKFGTHQVEACRTRVHDTVEELCRREQVLGSVYADLEKYKTTGMTQEQVLKLVQLTKDLLHGRSSALNMLF